MATENEEQPQENVLPKEGDILAGKYRIDRVIGQGGMGMVVAAHHTTLRQNVAIKFLLPEAAKRDDATERFLREARAAVSIQSEHVARVADVGTLDTGSPYMVMEYLTGADLGQILQQRGPLPIPQAIDYVLQACEAIAEAHSLGIIHRDLKPANLFVTQRADGTPLVKVLDFGLSKATKPGALDASLTAANVVMGSPFYMSPEQIRSLKGLDTRVDIWALGIILYQLITGSRPFEAESLGALFLMIGADQPPPMHPRRPDIPPELEAAILHCLEKDPRVRTQSVAELARALAPFGEQDSHISVERILRVLPDGTPFPRRGSVGDNTGAGQRLAEAAQAALAPAEVVSDTAATVALEPVPGPLVAQARTSETATEKAVKSGSMAALATNIDESKAPATMPPAAPSRGPRVALGVGAALVLGMVGVASVFGLRGGGKDGSAALQTTAVAVETVAPVTTGPQAAPSGGAPQAPSATPATSSATASAEPAATAPPVETAASAAPSASSSAKAGKAPKVRVPLAPTTKKSKDPLDKR
jgi:serine/threonine-protein kinase